MPANKYAIILGNLGNTCDRFCSGGYKENLDTMTMLKTAAAIDGVTGVELVGTWDIRPENVGEMAEPGRGTSEPGQSAERPRARMRLDHSGPFLAGGLGKGRVRLARSENPAKSA